MELTKGQIVMSRAGRDTCRWYAVIGQDNGRVLLANGEKFTFLHPKCKNNRHISASNVILKEEDMKTDLQLKQAILAFTTSRNRQMQGG